MLACHTDDVEGGEGLESEERLARIAVLGRASASLALPLLTGQLHGCLVQLQQSMQSGGRAFAHHAEARLLGLSASALSLHCNCHWLLTVT